LSPAKKTLIALGLGHAVLECFSGVWPIFKHLAHLDLQTAGLLAAITTFTAQALQPAFGHWADKGYERAMFLGGTALTFLLMLIGPIGANFEYFGPVGGYTILAVLMMLSRLGHSMFHPAGVTLAGQTLKDQQTAGLGIFIAMGWCGIAASQASFSVVYKNAAGHSELLILPAIVLMIWIVAWCKPVQHVKPAAGPINQKMKDIWVYRREVGALFVVMTMITASNTALVFMFPEFLEARGYSGWILEGGAMAVYLAGTALGVVLGGYASDRIGSYVSLLASMLLTTFSYQVLLLIPPVSGAAFLSICVLAGVLCGAGQPLPLAICQNLLPRNASLIGGILMGWTWAIGGGIAPLVVAYMVKGTSLGVIGSLSVMGIANVIALGCALTLILTSRTPAPAPTLTVPALSRGESGRLVNESAAS
jgi:MFS family permease